MLTLREICDHIVVRGRRTRTIDIITTLVDAVTVHGSGSGPFFGRDTRPRRYALAENMDLTPWNQAKSSTGL